MAYILKDLIVNRVDLVDEGANSAAFIELYKRKEIKDQMDYAEIISKMKPEHADVIAKALEAKDADITVAKQSLADSEEKLKAANDALTKANGELEALKAKDATCTCTGEDDGNGICKACGKPKKKAVNDDELVKGMPEPARALFLKMRTQKEAAEEQVRKAAAEKVEAEAVAKAAELKAIPVEQAKLVGVLKSCGPEVLELLTAANSAIEAAVLGEVGKNASNGASTHTADAWAEIEKKAGEIAVRDSITKEKAVGVAIKECPELYKQYLKGGAN